jgi:hypothetical protein
LLLFAILNAVTVEFAFKNGKAGSSPCGRSIITPHSFLGRIASQRKQALEDVARPQ